jgi:hypothetical protein
MIGAISSSRGAWMGGPWAPIRFRPVSNPMVASGDALRDGIILAEMGEFGRGSEYPCNGRFDQVGLGQIGIAKSRRIRTWRSRSL